MIRVYIQHQEISVRPYLSDFSSSDNFRMEIGSCATITVPNH